MWRMFLEHHVLSVTDFADTLGEARRTTKQVMAANSASPLAFDPAVRQWCSDLLQRPLPQTCWCHGLPYPRRTNRTTCCANAHPIDKWARDGRGAATFNSQHGQDWWIHANWAALGLPREHGAGTYVDLATNDPIFRSSTFFLDACLGWKGLCVEANPVHYYHIWQQRSCSLVPACASDTRKRIRFSSNLREPSGGSSRVGKATAVSSSEAPGPSSAVSSDRPSSPSSHDVIPCDTLSNMLRRSGLRHVDVLSLDVEGHESSVLLGLNFSEVSFGVILMEPSCRTAPQGCALLHQAGYTRLPDASFVDHAWVRKVPAAPTTRYRCRSHREAGHCRGWDYRGAPDYS